MQTLIKVSLEKVGLNPDSQHTILENDFSLTDNHPNVKMYEIIEGFVYLEMLIPEIGKSYCVFPTKETHRPILTTQVIKVKNLLTFTTKNSVYKIKINRIFDFKYKIPYVTLHLFDFCKKNKIVDLTNYKILETQIPRLVNILKNDPSSRKAIAVLCDNTNTPSCLISLQYLIHQSDNELILYCIANYRSQHAFFGLPYDQSLLNYLTTLFVEKYEIKFSEIVISVNVADFHDYEIKP